MVGLQNASRKRYRFLAVPGSTPSAIFAFDDGRESFAGIRQGLTRLP